MHEEGADGSGPVDCAKGVLNEQSKCKAWVPSMISPLPEAVSVFGPDNVSTTGLTVLGSAASGTHKTTISLP